MPDRAYDWLTQAEHDFIHAQEARHSKRHEWACFAAQQSAEKAVKALHLFFGQEAWGHVIARLLKELPEQIVVSDVLIDQAKVLDNFYIPTRYPNGHPDGPPFEHYGSIQSNEAIQYAGAILDFVRDVMARHQNSKKGDQ